METNELVNKLMKSNSKMQTALCRVTGIMEANIEDHIEKEQYEQALGMLRELLYIHKENPLSMSKQWKKDYEKKIDLCRGLRIRKGIEQGLLS